MDKRSSLIHIVAHYTGTAGHLQSKVLIKLPSAEYQYDVHEVICQFISKGRLSELAAQRGVPYESIRDISVRLGREGQRIFVGLP